MRLGRYRTALIVGVALTGLTTGTLAVAQRPAATAAALPTALDERGQPVAVGSVPGQGFAYTRLRNGVQVRVNGVSKTILFYGPSTVRVNTNLGRNYWTAKSIVVVAPPADIDFTVADGAGTLTIANARLRVLVDKATGAVSFFDAAGKLYTSEDRSAPQTVKSIVSAKDPSYEVENRFRLAPDEAIYGFGFTDDAKINRRGADLDLVQTNIGIIIPVMVSNRRYGVMWDTYSHMRFADDASGARLWAEDAPGGVDYYFMGADTMDGVVQAYRKLTGDAPMYPKQAFGLFMSKERYTTQARLVEVAETFRRERFPLDYIVQDWQYWGGNDGTWSGMTWDKTRFPDPEATIRRIHDMNLKLMVSIWPSVGDDTALGKELDQHGLRFPPLHWISKKARIYDAFSPLGRQIYFKHAKSGLLDKGVDALWMDGTEVEVSTAMHDAKAAVDDIKSLGRNAMGDFSRYLNAYTLMTTLGTYEGQRATSDKRALTLTRSAWAGAQRTGATSWSGDTQASWETLRHQVAGGVNVTVTGNPYWTQDTGGFFVNYGGGERNPHYRELFARWFQYATFNPLMRVHGTNIEREPYIFKTIDPQVYASLLGAVNLRYRLLPYIYGLGWQVTSGGYTMMRPLAMDFPDDTRVHAIDDAFMFGGSLLVHPVTRAMYHVEPEPAATVPAAALSTPDGKPGLAGQYFEGRNFDRPAGRVVDTVIDKRWPQPPLQPMPPGLTSLNDFSARWDGFLTAPEDGEFELGLQGDDGVRLFVDGRKLVDDWTSGASRYRSAKVTLRKGQRVAVRIEFYQGDGERDLRFTWRRPDELRAVAAKASEGPKLGVQTYLPAGSDWYDFWTNERMAGGRDVSRDAPLDVMPLYVRAGAILPMGPTQQYATEKPGAPYEIRVYPGANGRFTVYEDDNETYAYERGQRATYDLTWDDARRTLTIGARAGQFPGMIPTRQLNVVVVKPGAAGGIADLPATRSVTYTGKPVQLTF